MGGTEDDYLYGMTMVDVPAALLAGTPDSAVLPGVTTVGRLVAPEIITLPQGINTDTPLGISLGGTTTTPTVVTNSFALEGTRAEEKIKTFMSVGDINGDLIEDYLASGSLNSYVVLGPIEANSLNRTTVGEFAGSTLFNDVKVQFIDGSFVVVIDSPNELNSALDAHRILGRADVIIPTSQLGVPAQLVGNLFNLPGDFSDGVTRNDLVFVKNTGSNYVISIVAGLGSLPRTIDNAWLSANGSKVRTILLSSSLAPSVESLQLTTLDFNGNGRKDLVITSSTATTLGVVGVVFDGSSIELNSTLNEFNASRYLRVDTTDRNNYLQTVVQTSGGYTAGSAGGIFTSTAPGDVNGDGFEDLIIGDSRFIDILNTGAGTAPQVPFGRVYLILGSSSISGSSLELNNANYIWEDLALGAGVHRVGDVNLDGYDDLAFSRNFESAAVRGSSFVIAGSSGMLRSVTGNVTNMSAVQSGTSSSLLIAEFRRSLPSGKLANGTPQLTAGDFDGNGRIDIAIGLPDASTSDTVGGPTTVANDANQVYVFYDKGNIRQGTQTPLAARQLSLNSANAVLRGEQPGQQFGYLSLTPSIDLDNNGVSDLLVGAPNVSVSNGLTGGVFSNAGRIYAIYGIGRTETLPASASVLANRSVEGLGDFVVEQSNGQTFQAFGQLLPTGANVPNEQWYRFKTLGDGRISDQLTVSTVIGDQTKQSRPAGTRTYSTAVADSARGYLGFPGALTPVAEVLATGAAFQKNGDTYDLLVDTRLRVDGHPTEPNKYRSIISLDLSRFLSYVGTTNDIDLASLTLRYEFMGSVAVQGTVIAQVLDDEFDGALDGTDAKWSATRFRQGSGAIAVATPQPDSTGRQGTLTFQLLSQIQQALAAGKTHLLIGIEGSDTFVGDLQIDNLALSSASKFELRTKRRDGVMMDVRDTQGRLLASNQAIVDMRNFPAGEYFVRVYDPFAIPGNPLYRSTYTRTQNLQFALNIEAPKVGDADAPSDRDAIYGAMVRIGSLVTTTWIVCLANEATISSQANWSKCVTCEVTRHPVPRPIRPRRRSVKHPT